MTEAVFVKAEMVIALDCDVWKGGRPREEALNDPRFGFTEYEMPEGESWGMESGGLSRADNLRGKAGSRKFKKVRNG